jgi:hypothetical protein
VTEVPVWVTYPLLFGFVVAGAVLFRWVGRLQRRANDHAERIAHLEGQRDRDE